MDPLNLDEFEAIAKARLDPGVYGYFAGGAEDEVTVRANREAFRALCLKYRVLVDVSRVELGSTLLGARLKAPLILAPTALHRMAHPDGERATARAAAQAGVLMCLSTVSSVALEEVSAAAPEGARWFQLYHDADPGATEALVARADAAGYQAIVLTVDAPFLGRRERDIRIPFRMPDGVAAAHFEGRAGSPGDDAGIAAYIRAPALTWKDVAWTKALTNRPLVLKGIVRGDDANRAVDHGVAAIWVSNHGGRQLDTSIPTARALPEVVDAVAGRVPVIVDGGVRRGTDVIKALALGARAVAVGRPQLWALAAAGQMGVSAMLALLQKEIALSMALAGCPDLASIDRSLVA